MRFYVYAVIVDGVFRYIGKGSRRRLVEHLAIAKRLNRVRASGATVDASYFHNKLAKAIRAGADVSVVKLVEGLGETEAYEREREEIESAPEGQLWNRWVGGLGSFAASPELRERLSAAAKERYQDPVQLAAARAHMDRLSVDPAVRAKRSATQKRRFAAGEMADWHRAAHTPAAYAKRGETLKRSLVDRPDLRNRVAKWRAQNVDAHAASLKAAHARPDVKAKRRAYYDSPEGRAKLKAASDARWARVRAAQAVAS
jgi:hypothetical protein